jgi:hypothetical protein
MPPAAAAHAQQPLSNVRDISGLVQQFLNISSAPAPSQGAALLPAQQAHRGETSQLPPQPALSEPLPPLPMPLASRNAADPTALVINRPTRPPPGPVGQPPPPAAAPKQAAGGGGVGGAGPAMAATDIHWLLAPAPAQREDVPSLQAQAAAAAAAVSGSTGGPRDVAAEAVSTMSTAEPQLAAEQGGAVEQRPQERSAKAAGIDYQAGGVAEALAAPREVEHQPRQELPTMGAAYYQWHRSRGKQQPRQAAAAAAAPSQGPGASAGQRPLRREQEELEAAPQPQTEEQPNTRPHKAREESAEEEEEGGEEPPSVEPTGESASSASSMALAVAAGAAAAPSVHTIDYQKAGSPRGTKRKSINKGGGGGGGFIGGVALGAVRTSRRVSRRSAFTAAASMTMNETAIAVHAMEAAKAKAEQAPPEQFLGSPTASAAPRCAGRFHLGSGPH